MKISIIAAYGRNREIGLNNKLLWHISDDLKRFKRITSGHTVIMGRNTYESIGMKALPNRRNIVLSRESKNKGAGVEFARSVNEALALIGDEEEVFIIGGAKIYEQFLPFTDKMYLTRVHESYVADSFFPEFNPDEWKVIERTDIKDDPQAAVNYSYVTLERIK